MTKKKIEKEDEKKEILEELAKKLKEDINEKSSDENEEESGKSERDADLNDLELNQFVQPMHVGNTKTPILERIAGSQPRPIFVGEISGQSQTNFEGEKSGNFKYAPGQEDNDEPKYTGSDSKISREPNHIDMMEVGREAPERVSEINQEAFFMRQETNQQIESPTFEKKWEVKQIDVENQGRENPFKRKETKYENIK